MANCQIFLEIHQEGSEDWNSKKYITQKFPRKYPINFGRSKLVSKNLIHFPWLI